LLFQRGRITLPIHAQRHATNVTPSPHLSTLAFMQEIIPRAYRHAGGYKILRFRPISTKGRAISKLPGIEPNKWHKCACHLSLPFSIELSHKASGCILLTDLSGNLWADCLICKWNYYTADIRGRKISFAHKYVRERLLE
jgi:hypothetical protein